MCSVHFYIKLIIFEYISVFSSPQVTDSYTRLVWQYYMTDIHFTHIFGEGIEMPTRTYQIHNPVIGIFFNVGGGGGLVGCVVRKRSSNLVIIGLIYERFMLTLKAIHVQISLLATL